MKKWYLKLLLVITVIGLAELGYTIYNRPELMLKPYLRRVEKIKTSSEIEENLEYMDYVTEIRLSEIDENYRKNGEDIKWRRLQKEINLEDDTVSSEIQELLKTVDLEQIDDGQWLVYLYYQVGLLGAKRNNSNLVEYGWGRALRLAPEWSYFYTELANYYLVNGEKAKAFEVLEYCGENSHAKVACEEYFEDQFESLRPLQIGHWRQSVEDNYLDNME